MRRRKKKQLSNQSLSQVRANLKAILRAIKKRRVKLKWASNVKNLKIKVALIRKVRVAKTKRMELRMRENKPNTIRRLNHGKVNAEVQELRWLVSVERSLSKGSSQKNE
jgi:Holliday junction resolvasome RuvABC endonuclease subunit